MCIIKIIKRTTFIKRETIDIMLRIQDPMENLITVEERLRTFQKEDLITTALHQELRDLMNNRITTEAQLRKFQKEDPTTIQSQREMKELKNYSEKSL